MSCGVDPYSSRRVPRCASFLYALANSTRLEPSSVSIARNLNSFVFVIWQEYGHGYSWVTVWHDLSRYRPLDAHFPVSAVA
jgi:hypothetical protein